MPLPVTAPAGGRWRDFLRREPGPSSAPAVACTGERPGSPAPPAPQGLHSTSSVTARALVYAGTLKRLEEAGKVTMERNKDAWVPEGSSKRQDIHAGPTYKEWTRRAKQKARRKRQNLKREARQERKRAAKEAKLREERRRGVEERARESRARIRSKQPAGTSTGLGVQNTSGKSGVTDRNRAERRRLVLKEWSLKKTLQRERERREMDEFRRREAERLEEERRRKWKKRTVIMAYGLRQ